MIKIVTTLWFTELELSLARAGTNQRLMRLPTCGKADKHLLSMRPVPETFNTIMPLTLRGW